VNTKQVKVAEVTHMLTNVMQAVLGNKEVVNYRVRFGPYAIHIEDVISDIANSFLEKYSLQYVSGSVIATEGNLKRPLMVCRLQYEDNKRFRKEQTGRIQSIVFQPEIATSPNATLEELQQLIQMKFTS